MNFHHLGIVVPDISKEYEFYKTLGFDVLRGFETPKKDEEQKVWVGAVIKKDFLIELLVPLNKESPVYSFQKNGGGLHHICYNVEDIHKAIAQIIKEGAGKQITPITKSVWDNRPVTFFLHGGSIFEIVGKEF